MLVSAILYKGQRSVGRIENVNRQEKTSVQLPELRKIETERKVCEGEREECPFCVL